MYLNKSEEKNIDDFILNLYVKQIPGKPARKVYSVTPAGKKIMVDTVKEYLSSNQKTSDPFDLGMANLNLLTPDEVISSLEEYVISLEKRMKQIQDRLNAINKMEIPINIIALFTRPITILKCEKEWVHQFIKDYKKESQIKE